VAQPKPPHPPPAQLGPRAPSAPHPPCAPSSSPSRGALGFGDGDHRSWIPRGAPLPSLLLSLSLSLLFFTPARALSSSLARAPASSPARVAARPRPPARAAARPRPPLLARRRGPAPPLPTRHAGPAPPLPTRHAGPALPCSRGAAPDAALGVVRPPARPRLGPPARRGPRRGPLLRRGPRHPARGIPGPGATRVAPFTS
jgi:neural Wiskott-Aldrich syndrome protein